MREYARRPFSRPVIFGFIVAGHAALWWLLQRDLLRMPSRLDEPLQLFLVAPRVPVAAPPRPPINSPTAHPRAAPPAAAGAAPLKSEDLPATPPAIQSPLDVDWSAEAAIAAQHQSELAANTPAPRSLDDHHRHRHGVGLSNMGPYQFGWDRAATHRVETGGALIIHLNDRCVVGLLVILPFFGCAFGGEIPVDGELFKHMHDAPAGSVSSVP